MRNKNWLGLQNANPILLEVLIENVLDQWNDGEYDEPSLRNAMFDLSEFMHGNTQGEIE